MSNDLIIVGMADQNICKAPQGITTLGLGSCVGVAVWDPFTKVGGLAHVMLPDSKSIRQNSNLAKFADTAIVELVSKIKYAGGQASRLEAKMAGGAQMFSVQGKGDLIRVGERNVEACKEALKQLHIPLIASDTGNSYGRTVIFYPETGVLIIKAVGRDEIRI